MPGSADRERRWRRSSVPARRASLRSRSRFWRRMASSRKRRAAGRTATWRGEGGIEMARRTNEETLRRLEGLAAKGGFDKVRAAIGRRNPVVAEFGFSAETIREALDTPLPALEASGAMPLPVL